MKISVTMTARDLFQFSCIILTVDFQSVQRDLYVGCPGDPCGHLELGDHQCVTRDPFWYSVP